MKKLGLVTVLYGSDEVLPGFFNSLALQKDRDWHLEVIDNSPTDKALRRAQELACSVGLTDVSFVRNPDNYGVAKANNQGIQRCLQLGCDVVILLNNDIEFDDPELIASIRSEMEHGDCAMLAPRVHYFDSGMLWYGGGRIREIAGTVVHEGDRQPADGQFLSDHETEYAPTCFMAIKASVFQDIGLMDERYFVYYDDTDFVYRARRAGHRLKYQGTRSLLHKVSSSTGGGSSDFSIYYYNRNRLYFLRKHLKGMKFGLAVLWYGLTRLYKGMVYAPAQRRVLLRAMRDGRSLG